MYIRQRRFHQLNENCVPPSHHKKAHMDSIEKKKFHIQAHDNIIEPVTFRSLWAHHNAAYPNKPIKIHILNCLSS